MSELKSLNALLNVENVKEIYYIDDAHNSEVDYKTLVKAAILTLEADDNKLVELTDEYGILDFSLGDTDILNAKIEELWGTWTNETQFYYYTLLAKASQQKNELEKASIMSLLNVGPFAEKIKFLSPDQWIEQKDQIIASAKDGHRVMVLMDQELNISATRKGIDLLKEIENAEFMYLTLFTYSITTLDEEVAKRNELSDTHNLQKKSFFVLTKDRALNNQLFLDGIKKVLLNGYFDQIKDQAVKIITSSLDRTKTEIENMDTHQFDLTVLKSSAREGLWEGEMLFRIMRILFDKNIRKEMVDQGLPPTINPLIRRARTISKSHKITADFKEYAKNYTLRHREIYDNEEIINHLNLPIDNGDIFEITGIDGPQLWILVGQECDLMVRSNGKAASTEYASLFRVEKIQMSKLSTLIEKFRYPLKSHYMEKRFKLEYFEQGSSDVGLVQFSKEMIVDRRILDLVCFNEDGKAHIKLDQPLKEELFSPGINARFKIIQKFLQKQVSSQFENLDPEVSQILKLHFSFISDLKNEYNILNHTLDFGLKRVLRLRRPYSAKLLAKVMQMKSRVADDVDFADATDEA